MDALPQRPAEHTCDAETVNAECARVRCQLPDRHVGLHDDGSGSTWSDRGTAATR